MDQSTPLEIVVDLGWNSRNNYIQEYKCFTMDNKGKWYESYDI